MAVIQFLLGVNVAGQPAAVQQIFLQVLVNTLIALPVYALVRRADPPGAARRSAPAPPPRLHDRRALTAPAPVRAARADPALRSMIQNPDDRRPPLTPQLALRVAIIGGFALTMFAIIFFRLWFLQVLDGQSYLAQAQVNTLREVAIPAPRGDILDSSGALLVSSAQALDVQIEPPDLPVPVTTANMYPPLIPHADTAVYRRLAHVLGISNKPLRHGCRLAAPEPAGVTAPIKRYHLPEIQCLVATSVYQAPYANVTVKPDVIPDVEYFIAENQQSYRGVVVQQVYTRSYPYRDLAAQLFGTVGPLSAQEVGKNGLGIGEFKGLPAQSIVGQSGLEAEYNRYLQGVAGKQRIQINANNEFQKYLNVQAAGGGREPEAVARHEAPERGTERAPGVDDAEQLARRRVRGDEPAERRRLRDGVAADVQPQHLQRREAGLAVGLRPAEQRLQQLPADQSGDPERGADGLDVQADHGDRGARERELARGRHVRRHGPVLLPRHHRLPAQLRARRQRRAEAGRRDPGLRRHLLLQPRREDERGRAAGRAAGEVGTAVRHRATHRHRPAGRGHGHTADSRMAGEHQQARAGVRRRHGAVQGQAQARARRLRAGRVSARELDDRRQRQRGGRPGRRAGDAAAARDRLLGDRQRRHDRHPTRRRGHPERAGHGAAADRSAGPPASEHQSAVPADDPRGSAGSGLRARGDVSGCDGQLPRAGVRKDRDRAVHLERGRAGLRLVRVLRPGERDQQADRGGRVGGAGRVRRRRRRTGREADPVAVVPQQSPGRTPPGRGAATRYERQHADSELGGGARTAARRLPADRPAAAGGRARARCLLGDHAARRGRQRPGREAGAVRRNRPVRSAGADALRLLAAARVQVRLLRVDDRAEHRRVRHARRSTARVAGSRSPGSSSSRPSSARCC